MRVEDLSGEDAAVYRAVAEVEVGAGAPHLQDVARRAGLDPDRARAAVHRLLPGSHRPVSPSLGAGTSARRPDAGAGVRRGPDPRVLTAGLRGRRGRPVPRGPRRVSGSVPRA